MDLNNLSMLLHSLIVSQYKITNPYIIGLLSSFIMYVLMNSNKYFLYLFSSKFNYDKNTYYIKINKKKGSYDNDTFSLLSIYLLNNFPDKGIVSINQVHGYNRYDYELVQKVEIFHKNKKITIEYVEDDEIFYLISSSDFKLNDLYIIMNEIFESNKSFINKEKKIYNIKFDKPKNLYTWDNNIFNSCKSWENLFLDKNIKKEIQDDIKFFKDNKDIFNKKGIPYSRGYLFYGIPGGGKTSTCKIISNEFTDKNCYILDFNKIESDHAFNNLIDQIKESSIVILEDIDCVKACLKREFCENDLTIRGNVSLNNILNFIDGFQENNHIFIMTTNHIDKLDPALIRPGRFDVSFELKYATKQMFIEIFNFYCDAELDNLDFEFVENKFSCAYLINLSFTNRYNHDVIFETISNSKSIQIEKS